MSKQQAAHDARQGTTRVPPVGIEVRVPGSIANLGPGFDTLAVAVRLYLTVRIRGQSGRPGDLTFDFVDHELCGDNVIERALRLAADREGQDLPALELEVRSEIPMRAGLGSSAAATVAGLRLYEAVVGPRPPEHLLAIACAVEGHPDNVAAALLGGLTSSCQLEGGEVLAHTTTWPATLRLVVVTPDTAVETAAARRVLPDTITRRDAVFNLQRIALLLQSLQTGDLRHLREALRDRWHQPYRQPLVPGLESALALDHPDLLGVCLSGSGPSIVALAERNLSEIAALLSAVYADLGIDHRVRMLEVHAPDGIDASPSTRRVEQ